MGLFKSETNYKSVVDYIVALNEQEHKKLTKVVNIYRNAHSQVRGLLGGSSLADYKLEYEDIGEPVPGAKVTVKKAAKK